MRSYLQKRLILSEGGAESLLADFHVITIMVDNGIG
jgi:hypothetical protein